MGGGMSRPRKHWNNAAKQRAYRERKKMLDEAVRDSKKKQDEERIKRLFGW